MANQEDAEVDTATVDAVGKATLVRRMVPWSSLGFHPLIGRAHCLFEESARGLAGAGRHGEAAPL